MIGKDELTLTEDEVVELSDNMCSSGFRSEKELLFQSKANRDAVFKACKAKGAKLYRRSTGHQLLDPRYTVEGRHIPDQGLNNAYRTGFGNLYVLGRDL